MRLICLLSFVLINLLAPTTLPEKPIHHYVYFARDRESLKTNRSFLEVKAFEGAQVAYSWRQLEPRKDQYDFTEIRQDLEFLSARRKKLWIQIQDVTFDERYVPVPKYLMEDPGYHGGADRQYQYKTGDEDAKVDGWAMRRWDPAVQDRFHKLLFALGREFDGKIEGINFAESSVSFGETGRLYPQGFTPEIYRDAVVTNLQALKRAFPKSVALQYANFMPGEWRPVAEKGFLRAVYQAAQKSKVGVGGPDLLPYKPGQMGNSYPLIKEIAGSAKVGIAVQDGNYEHVNPKTGKRITIAEQIQFARDYLGADYIFWCTEEPYYSRDLVPYMGAKAMAKGDH